MTAPGPGSSDASHAKVGVDAARRELSALARRYARPPRERWEPVPIELDAALAADVALAEAAFGARAGLLQEVPRRLDAILADPLVSRYLEALLRVPRERYVLPEDIALSADDAPLPLDRAGLATVSAPHAYLLTYALLELGQGDHLLELGTGTGYGAAIAGEIVGPSGRVDSIEIDLDLAARALRLQSLRSDSGARRIALHQGDACEIAPGVLLSLPEPRPPFKVAVTFALHAVPSALVAALPEGARLVAPVSVSARDEGTPPCGRVDEEMQQLLLWEKRGGAIQRSAHGAVRYVTERH